MSAYPDHGPHRTSDDGEKGSGPEGQPALQSNEMTVLVTSEAGAALPAQATHSPSGEYASVGAGNGTGHAVSSMTGYARVAGRLSDALSFTLTLKSINHRYLDLQLRMPPGTDSLEAALRQRLKVKLVRGHVECVLTLERNRPARAATGRAPGDRSLADRSLAEGVESARSPAVGNPPEIAAARAVPIFDPAAVAAYLSTFRETARLHGLACEPDLNQIARMPGMLLADPAPGAERAAEPPDEETLSREVLPRLGEVLQALCAMRAEEGASLAAILRDGLLRLEAMVEEVALLRESVQEAHFARIRQRLEQLLNGSFEPDRVLQEAALLADRSDVEEETARMRTHIQHFRALLAAGGELGKKLDFLLQEMNREANTLLSKTGGVTGNGTRITACGLSMKAEIEKAREQVQNLE